MKRFNDILPALLAPRTVMSLFLIVIIVPNVLLSITESMTPVARVANVVLPLGVYWLLMTVSRRVAVGIWMLFPVMFFAAFQLVLLHLYGRSPIAVDMFLNLATTNTGEAMELLANLTGAIILVVVLYVPFLTWATIMLFKRGDEVSRRWMRHNRMAAGAVTLVGAALVGVCYVAPGEFALDRDIYPVNIAYNLKTAVDREEQIAVYRQNVKDFKFHALPTHPDSVREIYVLVIGETSRADHWSLLGYGRNTNPRLSRRNSLTVFDHAMSESNTTHKSVPMLLTAVDAAHYDDINRQRSLISAFREAGFSTAFLSTQARNHSYIDMMGEEADTCVFVRDRVDGDPLDETLMPLMRDVMARGARKQLIVLHTYGCHFNYNGRYGADCRRFVPDRTVDANVGNRATLVNAYDNAILATDRLLDDVIAALDSVPGASTAMLYAADHGEDIFDDSRGLFLHASPCPSIYQLHVPMAVWMDSDYHAQWSDKYAALCRNATAEVSTSDCFFHTALDIAGIRARALEPSRSVASAAFRPRPRIYINDRNEAVDLTHAGFQSQDFAVLAHRGL